MNVEALRLLVVDCLQQLAGAIVGHPEDLRITRKFEGERLTTLDVDAHAADHGRLIGKGGSRIRAFRHLLRAIGDRHGHTFKLGDLPQPRFPVINRKLPPFRFDPGWPKAEVEQLVWLASSLLFGSDSKVEIQQLDQTAVCIIRTSGWNGDRELLAALENIVVAIGTTKGCELSVDIR